MVTNIFYYSVLVQQYLYLKTNILTIIGYKYLRVTTVSMANCVVPVVTGTALVWYYCILLVVVCHTCTCTGTMVEQDKYKYCCWSSLFIENLTKKKQNGINNNDN